jgi:YHS domain-containing protein
MNRKTDGKGLNVMVRSLVLLSGAVLMVGQSTLAWAGTPSICPPPCPNTCVPNVGNFGYFPTTWRQWPGAQPLEQTNPQAVGREVIPTPVGQEPLPVPMAAPLQSPAVPPEPPVSSPQAGRVVPPEQSVAPEPPPTTTPAPFARPSFDGGLPGLPAEPDQSPRPAARRTELPKEMPKAQEPLKDRNLLPKVWRGPAEQTTKAAAPAERQPVADGDLYSRVAAVESQRSGLPVQESLPRTAVSPLDPSFVQRSDLPVQEHFASPIADAPEPPASTVAPASYVATAPVIEQPATETPAAIAAPPVALSSYCAVELVTNSRWVKGDLRWTVVHQGWIYRFSGPAQRQQFLANPEAFAPVNSGNDAVLTVDENRSVMGQATYCAMYNGRLYTFSSAATQARFNECPQRYAPAGQ